MELELEDLETAFAEDVPEAETPPEEPASSLRRNRSRFEHHPGYGLDIAGPTQQGRLSLTRVGDTENFSAGVTGCAT
ncbi:hypothetical protein LWC05_08280 [Acetobacter sicerae]|uniref:Uncharacterized protein n=1 Tax=Acetobacter sicerae TaxID=85325 RepID=A0ABS8VXT3_9PROT|nr:MULTISPECIES: hypothetical protein [Acetobacter]MBC9008951.1 hypothetical protein [Acetobacter tropicalis]MCE0743884.1 hypothetical protein [Acetobacter sicerae]